jgi:hypothetical protein
MEVLHPSETSVLKNPHGITSQMMAFFKRNLALLIKQVKKVTQ